MAWWLSNMVAVEHCGCRTLSLSNIVAVEFGDLKWSLQSGGIPNHDFNDATAWFATRVAEPMHLFEICAIPRSTQAGLSQGEWDAVMLNGVVLDLPVTGSPLGLNITPIPGRCARSQLESPTFSVISSACLGGT